MPLVRCLAGLPDFFTKREGAELRRFSGREMLRFHAVSDNGCPDACEIARFTWREYDWSSLADAHERHDPTAARGILLTIPVSICGRAQHILQDEHGQSEANLLGFDLGGAALDFQLPVSGRSVQRRAR